MRAVIIAACLVTALAAAAPAYAQNTQDEPRFEARPESQVFRPSPFVISGDACGASRYAHFVGEPFATMHHASLPNDARVARYIRPSTLEYRPERLNVVVSDEGRVTAIGCF